MFTFGAIMYSIVCPSEASQVCMYLIYIQHIYHLACIHKEGKQRTRNIHSSTVTSSAFQYDTVIFFLHFSNQDKLHSEELKI